MRDDIIQEQVTLQRFNRVKVVAAIILSQIKRFKICPLAVKKELPYIAKCRAHVNSLSILESQRYCEFYRYYSDEFATWTLVRHPVGRHLDVFKGEKASLENRICFSCKLLPEEKLKTGSARYGRGGAGINSHCFALLDW